jgi:beta-glucanase (GH16 family)
MRQSLRSHRLPKLGAVAVALLVTSYFVAGPSSPDAAAAIGGLTWSDEFNGPAGAAPDPGKWGRDTGGGGFGNNELEYYTTGTSNAALDGQGNLVITARKENPANYGCWYGSCQYTSARLNTAGRFTQAYGRFEARLKIPRGQGLWPAFWMLGNDISSVGWPNSGEIDVMENVGFEPNTVHGSLHGPGYSGGSPLTGTYSLPGGAAFADGFHTFTVDWAPDSVAFSVDGAQYARHTPSETRGNPWVFNHPFFIILNVAVGGNWPGSPNASTVFPQQMVVDYVRAYAYTVGGRTGGITGYGGKCVDVDAANPANGTQVQLYTCNGTNAQQWTVNGNQLQALGKCLDVSGAGTVNGTRVQLWDCNGTGAQQWIASNGQLVNPNSNKCLDATGPSSADRTPLQIWTCSGGANQKWTLP